MKESFISYLWKYRLLSNNLKTLKGESLFVVHPGHSNPDSGPDFFNSRIRIGDTVWAGNVEIHVRASDWFQHHHAGEPAYDNIVLHVVYESDVSIDRKDGSPIPTLVVKDQFPPGMYDRYEAMLENKSWVPCANILKSSQENMLEFMWPSLAISRLIEKVRQIDLLFEKNEFCCQDTFYQHLASCFGFRTNALAFEMLARSLPISLLQRISDDRELIEAVMFGQANLLPAKSSNSYVAWMIREYDFFRDKHELQPLPPGLWKFLRMRPSNFPTIRLSQFCSFLYRTKANPYFLTEILDIRLWEEFLRVPVAPYWETHFVFDVPAIHSARIMGDESIQSLIINGFIPYIFANGGFDKTPGERKTALGMLDSMPAESNSLIKKWIAAGIRPQTALQSQALIQLKNCYCDKKRCLQCSIGQNILTGVNDEGNG